MAAWSRHAPQRLPADTPDVVKRPSRGLHVRPDQEAAFEAAFAQAESIIASMPGFRSLNLSRCVERPSTYLLLVEWDEPEDHTVGFRGSPDYDLWRQLLHHFYEPVPTVEHYERVFTL